MNTKPIALSLALILTAPALYAADDARTTDLEEAFAGLAVDAEEEAEVITPEMALNNLLNSTRVLLATVDHDAETTLADLRSSFTAWRNALQKFAALKQLPAINRDQSLELLDTAKELMSSVDTDSFLEDEATYLSERAINPLERERNAFPLLIQATRVVAWDALTKASQEEAVVKLLQTADDPYLNLVERLERPITAVPVVIMPMPDGTMHVVTLEF